MTDDSDLFRLIDLALEEDVGPGDWTTEWTVNPEEPGEAVIVVKEPLVVFGLSAARAVFRRVDETLVVSLEAGEGSAVEAGENRRQAAPSDPAGRSYNYK